MLTNNIDQYIKNLKDRVNAEMKRRNSKYGSMTSLGNESFANDIGVNDPILTEHVNKTTNRLLQVSDYGDNRKFGDFQTGSDTGMLEASAKKLSELESQNVYSGNGCRGLCSGLCTGTCFNQCQGCTGCSNGCSSCSGGCGGNCQGGCSGACTNGCGSGCTNGCGSGCTSNCGGNCTGCKKSCSGSCINTCTGNCTTSCSGGCLYIMHIM